MNKISTKELFQIWGKVAANSFGGPAGQIAVIHQLVVEEKKIISEEKFLHALNFCMLLPGPEAQQLATYMGWIMNKWKGGLIAGGLFILPGFFSILALSYLYVLYNDLSVVQGIFYGIKPAIIAIVISALYKISKKSLKGLFYWIIALAAFMSLFFFKLPFPLVVISAAFIGTIYGSLNESSLAATSAHSFKTPKISESLKTLFLWLTVWVFPIILIFLTLGPHSNFSRINIFFSKMSLVTFGGAYAALSYVAQQAVDIFGWLQGNEMLDGLALAETTPGPLIQVVQYVGFMGAYRFPEDFSPLMAAFIGSVLTTWMTFAPCFLFIFTLAPYVEAIRGNKHLSYALQSITAAVVGVIFNLSLWFTLQALFLEESIFQAGLLNFSYPEVNSLDVYAFTICSVALFMQFKMKSSLFKILGISILLGVGVKFLIL